MAITRNQVLIVVTLCGFTVEGCAHQALMPPAPVDIAAAQPPPVPPELYAPVDGRAYASVQIDEALLDRQLRARAETAQAAAPAVAVTRAPSAALSDASTVRNDARWVSAATLRWEDFQPVDLRVGVTSHAAAARRLAGARRLQALHRVTVSAKAAPRPMLVLVRATPPRRAALPHAAQGPSSGKLLELVDGLVSKWIAAVSSKLALLEPTPGRGDRSSRFDS